MATMGAAFKTVEQRMRFTTRGMDKTTSEADWTLALERESVVSEYGAEAIGQASMRWRWRWPPPLRQRFASALRYRTQKRWPYSPYRAPMNSCKQFDYAEL